MRLDSSISIPEKKAALGIIWRIGNGVITSPSSFILQPSPYSVSNGASSSKLQDMGGREPVKQNWESHNEGITKPERTNIQLSPYFLSLSF